MCLLGGFWQTLTCLFSPMIKICQSTQVDLGNDPALSRETAAGGALGCRPNAKFDLPKMLQLAWM